MALQKRVDRVGDGDLDLFEAKCADVVCQPIKACGGAPARQIINANDFISSRDHRGRDARTDETRCASDDDLVELLGSHRHHEIVCDGTGAERDLRVLRCVADTARIERDALARRGRARNGKGKHTIVPRHRANSLANDRHGHPGQRGATRGRHVSGHCRSLRDECGRSTQQCGAQNCAAAMNPQC